jgi:hypothetical protein
MFWDEEGDGGGLICDVTGIITGIYSPVAKALSNCCVVYIELPFFPPAITV